MLCMYIRRSGVMMVCKLIYFIINSAAVCIHYLLYATDADGVHIFGNTSLPVLVKHVSIMRVDISQS